MVDTVIRLFESTATEFTTNGIGVLSDVIKCEVVEERNGQFELSMEYPIDGRRFDDLVLRRLIVAKPNPFDDPQPFRIYNITKPFNGRVTVSAEHISYDLSGYVVGPFTATKVGPAFTAIVANSTPQVPFTFYTDKSTDADMEVKVPTSLRSLLGGTEGSILDIYGPGEYVFDEFEVRFLASRGVDDGVTIRYGKNLTDLEQEENCAAVYTHVFPYWYSEDDGLLAPVTPVPTGGTFNYTRIMPLDLTSEFENMPELTDLVSAATSYVQRNELGVPKVSLKVSFVQLAQSEEYKMYELLEDVRLCDTVTVEFPKLGVSATSKCIKTTYDAISGKYISLELGESRTNLSTTIERQSAEIAKNSVEKNMPVIKSAIDKATKLITGGLGGYVVMHDYSDDQTPPDGYPDEILILDEHSGGVIANATNVWRWNKDGLGFSNHGYDGPYETAITSDGKIVANFILAGVMSANHIKGGYLQMGGTNAEGSYGNGTIEVYDANDNLIGRFGSTGINMYAGDIELNNSSQIVVPIEAWDPSQHPLKLYINSWNGFTITTDVNISSEPYNRDDFGLSIGRETEYIGSTPYDSASLSTSIHKHTTFWKSGLTPTGFWSHRDDYRQAQNDWLETKTAFISCDSYYGLFIRESGGSNNQLSWAFSDGIIYASGGKSRIMSTEDYATRALYCYETPTPMFGDIGEGEIGEDGTCYISFDPIFAETIDTEKYYVQLQKYGEGDCWVSTRTGGYFIVEGTPGLSFGWELKAKQKNPTYMRLDPYERDYVDISTVDYGQLAIEHITQIKEERAA